MQKYTFVWNLQTRNSLFFRVVRMGKKRCRMRRKQESEAFFRASLSIVSFENRFYGVSLIRHHLFWLLFLLPFWPVWLRLRLLLLRLFWRATFFWPVSRLARQRFSQPLF